MRSTALSLLAMLLAAGCEPEPPSQLPPAGTLEPTLRVGHGELRAAAPSPDLDTVYAGTTLGVGAFPADGGAARWFVETDGEARAVSVSGDGQRVGASTTRGLVAVWDAESASELYRATPGGAPVVALDRTGAWLAMGGSGGAVSVYNVETGAEVLALSGLLSPVSALAFSPDGARLAGADRDGRAVVWDARQGGVIQRLDGAAQTFNALAWSPDGRRIALAGNPSGVLTVRDGGWRVLSAPGGVASAVAWSRDGRRVAAGMLSRRVYLWDATSGALLPPVEGPGDVVRSVWFGSKGELFFGDSTVVRWSLRDGAPRGALPLSGVPYHVALSPTGALAALGSSDRVSLWSTANGAPAGRLDGQTAGLVDLAFSVDGRAVQAGSRREVLAWDTETGQRRYRRSYAAVHALAVSPDGRSLSVAASDEEGGRPRVALLDAATGEERRSLELGELEAVHDLVFSRDGRRLAIARESAVIVFEIEAGEGRLVSQGARGRDGTLAWSPDGSALAIGDQDNRVAVWRAERGLEHLPGRVPGETLTRVTWSPDGGAIAALGQRGAGAASVTAWDLTDDEPERLVLEGAGAVGYDLAYTPDSGLLVGLFGDAPSPEGRGAGRVVAWDRAGNVVVDRADLAGQEFRSLALSRDGGTLLTGAGDGTAWVWSRKR